MTPTRTTEPAFRWVIVAAAAAMLAIAMGQLVNGLSAFLAPLEREFGATRGQIALVNTMGLVGLAIGGIVMGALADRVSIRAVVLVGAVMTGLCVTTASQVTTLWQLHLLFLLAGPRDSAAVHLRLLSKLARLLSDPEFRRALLDAPDGVALAGLILDADEA